MTTTDESAGTRAETPQETFPYQRNCPFALPAEYKELRAKPGPTRVPMAPGGGAWLVTRHSQVRTMLGEGRLSNNRAHPAYPAPIPIPPEIRSGGSLLV